MTSSPAAHRGSSPCFESQEVCLCLKAAGKTSQGSVNTDDAMARHNDRERIFAVGMPDRSNGLGSADHLCQAQVASGFTVRDFS
jgi:hypothetical protein